MVDDVDRIIEAVEGRLPDVEIVQMHKTHPADDDGLWWFKIGGIKSNIQIESSTYNLPFLVEHDGMKSSSEALLLNSVESIVDVILAYLNGQRLCQSSDRSRLTDKA